MPLSNASSLYSPKAILPAVVVSAFYLMASYFIVGFRTDQVVLVGLFNALYFASGTTRRFILAFSVYIVYWIVFDYMKAFPNYRYNEVHIRSLYEWEKGWFGIAHNGGIRTPNEALALYQNTALDVLSGFFYLCWIPVPLAFAAYLFFKNRTQFFQFSLSFLLVNLIGFAGYYLYPAAPPWYVALRGFNFDPTTPGNVAGLGRFDDFFGVKIFEGIYAKSSNVFAAMPSLHAAYMLIVLWFGVKLRMRWWNLLFAVVVAGIWFAAVYSGHHYVLDVAAGILCSLLGTAVVQAWSRSGRGKRTLAKWVRATSAKPAEVKNTNGA